MGDLQERLSVSSSSSSSPPSSSPMSSSASSSPRSRPQPLPIDTELWLMAEERTQEILSVVQPALVSDRSRQEIIDYLRTRINSHHGIEVFSFGSVPLKTYLPDGDIDLTVLSHRNVEEELAKRLCSVLEEGEEQDSRFQVTDVQYIRAQVKVIKCNIKNIAVDISFNQMSGLCALCFLEQVDQLIGKDHLFKRSVVLIKAWCYYESRILGAHTGLISTYALSVLVLYIINLFHSSLCGPLAVLYKFLDYYGKFDWDHYCVSVSGPVAISSLPEFSVPTPENDGHELLLSQEFLRGCRELYSVPTRAVEANGHDFPVKHLNVLDPLKHSNNLGRSVTKGNFQRIRHAFSLGAQRLREILMQPGETMGSRLEKFFTNTLDRNGKGQREDVYEPVAAFGIGRSEPSELGGDYHGYYKSLIYGQWYHGYMLPGATQPGHTPSTSQIQDTSAWDIVRWYMTCQRNEFFWMAPNASTPSHSHPHTSQLPFLTSSFLNKGKCRGTCPYIPDMNHQSYRCKLGNPITRKPKSTTARGSLVKSCEQTDDRVEVTTETSNNGTGDCFDHSPKGFSSCLGIKEGSVQSEAYDPDQPSVRYSKADNCFPSPGKSLNGADEHSRSMSGLYSPPEKKLDPIS